MTTLTPTHVLACHECQHIGPTLQLVKGTKAKALLGPDAGRDAKPSQVHWAVWLEEHDGHDVRLIVDDYDPAVPIAGWEPRPPHGPPESGRRGDQVVTCPACFAMWRYPDDPTRGTACTWWTTDEGKHWFWFCRLCANVWGQAVDVMVARAELTDSEPDVWSLQRQARQATGDG